MTTRKDYTSGNGARKIGEWNQSGTDNERTGDDTKKPGDKDPHQKTGGDGKKM